MAICLSVDFAVGESRDIWKLGIFEGSCCLATGWALSILLVSCQVEGDEEDEVGADYAHACECCKLLAGAVSCIWHPLEVGRGEVGVRGEVDES